MPTPDWNATPPDELLRRVKARGNHLRTRRQVTVLAVVIAMLGVTASATALTSGSPSRTVLAGEGDGGSPGTEEADSTTTSTPAAEGGDQDEAGGAGADGEADTKQPESTSTTSTTAAAGSSADTTTTAKPGTTTSTTTGVALSVPHPREGTYRYRATYEDGRESDMRVTYEVLLRSDTEVRLRKHQSGPAPEFPMTDDANLAWRPDRVLVLNGDTCDEAPMENAHTLYRFPLSTGSTWSWDSTCSSEDSSVRRRGTAKVVGGTTQTIGGQTVDVRVISATGALDITIRGVTQTFYGDFEERFAPEHGLRTWTRSQTRQTKERTGTEGAVVTELLHLDPE